MYNNVGKKIKGLATAVAAIGIIVSIILGIVIMVTASNSYFMSGGTGVLIGFLVMGLGCLSSWLSSIKLYAFGQLVESAQNIERKIFGDESVRLSSNDEKSVFEKVTSVVNSDSTGNSSGLNKKYTCPNCQGEIKISDNNCRHCGSKINWYEIQHSYNNAEEANKSESHCPNCGTELKPDAVFCTKCGTKIN